MDYMQHFIQDFKYGGESTMITCTCKIPKVQKSGGGGGIPGPPPLYETLVNVAHAMHHPSCDVSSQAFPDYKNVHNYAGREGLGTKTTCIYSAHMYNRICE